MKETRRLGACALGVAGTITFGTLGADCGTGRPVDGVNVSPLIDSAAQMLDSKRWTTANLDLDVAGSYCYEHSEVNCGRYGRLYTWDAARAGCQSLGDGWHLPTDDEWREMTKHYGGIRDESSDSGKTAYAALLAHGSSGFNALLGGNRSENGQYERLEAHGFYWTATDSTLSTAWFYNFGRGGRSVNRHREGDKRMAVSVRCVRD